jgi:hypothetical protein
MQLMKKTPPPTFFDDQLAYITYRSSLRNSPLPLNSMASGPSSVSVHNSGSTPLLPCMAGTGQQSESQTVDRDGAVKTKAQIR